MLSSQQQKLNPDEQQSNSMWETITLFAIRSIGINAVFTSAAAHSTKAAQSVASHFKIFDKENYLPGQAITLQGS